MIEGNFNPLLNQIYEESLRLGVQKNTSLWQENKWEIMCTVALSVVAIAFPIFFLHYLKSPHHNLLLDKADSNRIMATDIKNFHEIAHLKKINETDISLIEKRGRPGKWSDAGFLGREDSLLEVLQKDWKTVSDLGTTHIEFADHLKSIFDIAFENFYPEGLMSYDFNSLNGNTINNSSSVKQFKVQIIPTKGWQNDIFDPCMTDDESDLECSCGSVMTPLFWSTDLFLTNPKNKEHVHVTEGTIQYIRKYGFYESGKENYYRIDPIRLASVFTGHSYCSIARAIKQPCYSTAPRDPYYEPN